MENQLHFRKNKARLLVIGLALVGASALSGCATTTHQEQINPPPVLSKVDVVNAELRNLPPPVQKTVVAVYDLEDRTGQYKERDNVQSLSRAVTQGGGDILITALQDAGERRWFTVLERKELDNLLKERQIVTEMRRIYRKEQNIDASVLPPLMHAGIIIEGAIIGYDTNTVTGGAGAGFLGISASAKYIQDTVTVTLRAVSTKSGEVLSTVTARKAIASYGISGGAFRFVKLDELLEAEVGVTYNEPKQIAIQSVIEKAVIGLIVEGAERGVWNFADPAAGEEITQFYRDYKYGKRLTTAAITPEPTETEPPLGVPSTVPVPVSLTVHRVAAAQPDSSVPDKPTIMQRIIRGGQPGSVVKPPSAPTQTQIEPPPTQDQEPPPPVSPEEPALG